MPVHPRSRAGAAALALGTALVLTAGCGHRDATVAGPAQPVGGGTASTYVTLDADGHPTEVGVRLTRAALDGLPDQPTAVMLAFPEPARETVFDNVMLNWNPHGHDPLPPFGRPHFEVHFDMVDQAALTGVDPADPAWATKAAHSPEARYVPADYVLPPGPPAPDQAVPGMNVHLVDATLVPGSYDFRQILINGTWDGRYTFIEPMVTQAWPRTGPTLHVAIKQPRAYQRSGYYPTVYSVRADGPTQDYLISLGGLTARTAG
jgi:hypothetical protein